MVLTRRQALTGIAVAGAAGLQTSEARAAAGTATARAVVDISNACVLTPQAVEGPYYFDPKLVRADITEGKRGVPVKLALQVIEAGPCTAIAGARIDVWHADASGLYSGYAQQGDERDVTTTGQTFMRGTQMTDARGAAQFQTVYPGWYKGRTPHIHARVFLDRKTVLMGQIYFPDALSEFIYQNVAPYNARKSTRDTSNATDGVLRESGGDHGSFCSIKEESDCYVASLIIAVDRNAEIKSTGPGGPPPGGMGPPPDGEGPPGFGPGGEDQTIVPASLVPGAATSK